MANYTVFDEGETRKGDAKKILEEIRQQNSVENTEIAHMTVEQYAEALIEDAPYFLPTDLLSVLEKQEFDSIYDKALTYMSQMPTSGVRILAVSGA